MVTRRYELPTYDEIDRLVDEDTLALRDLAWKLRTQLDAAEQVCILFGWTSLGDDSDKSKAVEQAWHEWAAEYGSMSPTPEWRQRIKELARRREEIRARTLAAIRSKMADGADGGLL